MEKRKFASVLSRTSKKVLEPLIKSLGLREREESILLLKYVKEKCYYDIADEMGLAYESASNFLCMARKSMYSVMTEDYNIFSDETKTLIDMILKKC